MWRRRPSWTGSQSYNVCVYSVYVIWCVLQVYVWEWYYIISLRIPDNCAKEVQLYAESRCINCIWNVWCAYVSKQERQHIHTVTGALTRYSYFIRWYFLSSGWVIINFSWLHVDVLHYFKSLVLLSVVSGAAAWSGTIWPWKLRGKKKGSYQISWSSPRPKKE